MRRTRGIFCSGRAHNNGGMDHAADKLPEPLLGALTDLGARDLYATEMYFRNKGICGFVYDELLDLFRFPQDSRFAFCQEVADWKRLRERGYLDF
jgi:hypothetical protein